MRSRIWLACFGLILLGFAPARAAVADCRVEIENPSIRLNPIAGRPGAGYMALLASCADTLVSANSPDAARVEIHQHIMTGDIMKMVKIDTLDLLPGTKVGFEPMGYHLMIFNVKQPVPKTLTITLTFAKSPPLTVAFPVR